MILQAEHKVKRSFEASSNSKGWRFDSLTAFRFLFFLILILLPGSVIALPLWWWLTRHRAEQTRGAHQ